ncbi:MAG: hypothetical protein RJB59_184, partial [Actinomycetota bacterium]
GQRGPAQRQQRRAQARVAAREGAQQAREAGHLDAARLRGGVSVQVALGEEAGQCEDAQGRDHLRPRAGVEAPAEAEGSDGTEQITKYKK